MATLRLFASAREAAGVAAAHFDGSTVGEVLDGASGRYGARFDDVLGTCRVWVNGAEADRTTSVGERDEVAVLPPVSGGSG